MTDQNAQTRPPAAAGTRAAVVGLSALLVIGVVLGASFRTVDPAIRQVSRDTDRAQTPARLLTVSLAKAVRELVGGDLHKPCLSSRGPAICVSEPAALLVSAQADAVEAPCLLVRLALLDLPPPVTAA